MNTNLELSIEIIYRIVDTLNSEVEKHGTIKRNNKLIWHGYLHKMDNSVWLGIIDLWEKLSEQHPEMFKHYDLTNIESAKQTIKKYSTYYDRVLDIKNKKVNHKKLAWRLLMTTREVWNRCCDIDPEVAADENTNNFHNIMDLQEK